MGAANPNLLLLMHFLYMVLFPILLLLCTNAIRYIYMGAKQILCIYCANSLLLQFYFFDKLAKMAH